MSEISVSHFATPGPTHSNSRRPIVAITGAAGQLGTALQCDPFAADVEVRALTRAQLDITDLAAVEATPLLDDVDIIINAAAATDVDGAESDPGSAHLINALGPKYLAARAKKEDAYLIHISTDYVFGDVAIDEMTGQRRALRVDDFTAPRTMYGRTKLVGESNVHDSGARFAILRTAWVWSGPTQPEAKDFVSTMIRLAETATDDQGNPAIIKVVDDQHGNPTFVGDLAGAIWELSERVLSEPSSAPTGTFHVTGSGEATWFEVAREVFRLTGHDPQRVVACTSSEFPRPAPRPAWSVLDGSAWSEVGLHALPEWQDTLRAVLT